jgi:glycerophosphoryl diester phosphodiesterase
VNHPFFDTSRPLVFAHRGGAALAPENTLAAFDLGLSLGADGLELDVRLSRDGIAVVHHDETLERTTNLRGGVADFTAGELGRADAGYWFRAEDGRTFRGLGHGIPRLDEVLSRYRDVRLIIEMKDNSAEMAHAVLGVLRAADAIERVCLGSFRLRALRIARAAQPALATSAAQEEVRWALYRSWVRWPVRHAGYRGYQVPEVAGRTRVVSPRFIETSHRGGLPVQVWTVDSESDARRLLGWGADALITNRPDLLVPLVGKPQGACRARS